MNKISVILILILSLFNKAVACLNGETMFLKDGTFFFEDRFGNVPYGHRFNSDGSFKRGIKQLDSLYKATKDLDYLSDKGLLLILLKEYDQAIKLYLEIEQLKPNRYSTASNIGTAYELAGQNKTALEWIRKSIEIDPKSHKNSEWIHVRILEAKIKGEEFHTTNFLLKTDFGIELLPKTTFTKSELKELSDALYYQLNERISFVKPPEKIVAQLLFDLGNVAFLLGNYRDAIADYEQAKEYGFATQLIESRIKESDRLEKLQRNPRKTVVKKQVRSHYLTVGIALTILTLTTLIIYKRRKKNRS